jgi:hypothetical protein
MALKSKMAVKLEQSSHEQRRFSYHMHCKLFERSFKIYPHEDLKRVDNSLTKFDYLCFVICLIGIGVWSFDLGSLNLELKTWNLQLGD